MKRSFIRLAILATGMAGVAIAAANLQARSTSPSPGEALYDQYGCFACHGHAGGGGAAGPAIFGRKLPAAYVLTYLRKPAGVMPPYRRDVLDDVKAEAIAEYVASTPTAKPYGQVPSLTRLAPKPVP